MSNKKKPQNSNDLLGFELSLLQKDLTKTVVLSLFLVALLLGIAWWQRQ